MEGQKESESEVLYEVEGVQVGAQTSSEHLEEEEAPAVESDTEKPEEGLRLLQRVVVLVPPPLVEPGAVLLVHVHLHPA